MDTTKTSFLKNQFIRIGGWQALLLGIAGLALISLVEIVTPSMHNLTDNPWYIDLLHNAVYILIPSTVFYLSGKIFSKSRSSIRYIDVVGTVTFSMIPLLLGAILMFIYKSDLLPRYEEPPLAVALIVGLTFFSVWLVSLTLNFYWAFQALKTSTNLRGPVLTVTYILGIALMFVYLFAVFYPTMNFSK